MGNTNNGVRRAIGLAFSNGVPARALVVALVVGTVLNLINQGEALARPETISWAKLFLTYLVPYLVSTHGSVAAALRQTAPSTK